MLSRTIRPVELRRFFSTPPPDLIPQPKRKSTPAKRAMTVMVGMCLVAGLAILYEFKSEFKETLVKERRDAAIAEGRAYILPQGGTVKGPSIVLPLRPQTTKRDAKATWQEDCEARKIANSLVWGNKDEARSATMKYMEQPVPVKEEIEAIVQSLESMRALRESVLLDEGRKWW